MSIKVMTRGGKPLMKDGKVAVTKDDGKICGGCCSGPIMCDFTITVVFAGINFCPTQCFGDPPDDFQGGFLSAKVNFSGISGASITIPSILPEFCIWESDGNFGTQSNDFWSSVSNCSGAPDGSQSNAESVRVRFSDGLWKILIFNGPQFFPFWGTLAASRPVSGAVVHNRFTTCDQLYVNDTGDGVFDVNNPCYSGGYGGTATITF